METTGITRAETTGITGMETTGIIGWGTGIIEMETTGITGMETTGIAGTGTGIMTGTETMVRIYLERKRTLFLLKSIHENANAIDKTIKIDHYFQFYL